MDQPSKGSAAMRLGAFLLVLLDVALAALNCFYAHCAISIASEDMLGGGSDQELLAFQVHNFARLGVPETTIIAAIVCSIHAIVGVSFIYTSRHKTRWYAFVSVQFVLALILLFMGGFMAVKIPAYHLLFKMYLGRYGDLYYHIMYYGSVTEVVYGGLWIIVPCAILAVLVAST